MTKPTKKPPAHAARKSRPKDQIRAATMAPDQAHDRFLAGAREVYERVSEIKQAGFDTEQAIRELAAIHQRGIDELEAVGRTLAGEKPLHADLARALKHYRKDVNDLHHALTAVAKADKKARALGADTLPTDLLLQHHESREGGRRGGDMSVKKRKNDNAPRDKKVIDKWIEYTAGNKPAPQPERIGKIAQATKVPRSTVVDILTKSGHYKPKKKSNG